MTDDQEMMIAAGETEALWAELRRLKSLVARVGTTGSSREWNGSPRWDVTIHDKQLANEWNSTVMQIYQEASR